MKRRPLIFFYPITQANKTNWHTINFFLFCDRFLDRTNMHAVFSFCGSVCTRACVNYSEGFESASQHLPVCLSSLVLLTLVFEPGLYFFLDAQSYTYSSVWSAWFKCILCLFHLKNRCSEWFNKWSTNYPNSTTWPWIPKNVEPG